MEKPTLQSLIIHSDTRGDVKYLNEFDFHDVKRFYHIKLPKKGIIRAFHGHMIEKKYAYIIKGTILVILAPLTKAQNPSKKVELKKYVLSADNPSILAIPAGYANGIMSLENNSEIIFYSSLSLEESQKDDYRYPENYWGDEIWTKTA